MVEGLSTLEIAGLVAFAVGVPVGIGKSMAMLNQAITLGKAAHRRMDEADVLERANAISAGEERGRARAESEALHRDLKELKETLSKNFHGIREEMTQRFGRIDERLDRR
jgi:hypothetical protein